MQQPLQHAEGSTMLRVRMPTQLAQQVHEYQASGGFTGTSEAARDLIRRGLAAARDAPK